MRRTIVFSSVLLLWAACSPETEPPAADDVPAVDDVSDVEAPDPDPDDGPAPKDEGPPPELDTIVTPPDAGPPPEPADPMVCTANITGELQEFGGSCCYAPATHPQNSSCVWYDDNYDNSCLDAQCGTGECFQPFCTKTCTLGADKINNASGDTGSDGVTDPTAANSCEGAVDGPLGTQFRCVQSSDPENDVLAFCQPGTTFAACDWNGDCPDGEVCDLMYIRGQYGMRCVIPPKGGLPGSADCNADPNNGEGVSRCTGPFCFGSGCVDACAEDDHCATDTCTGGKCDKSGATCESSADCSAWSCDTNFQPYSNSSFTDGFCQPRQCFTAAECNDPDWFCRPFWNGAETVAEAAFSPGCRRVVEGTAQYGEPCNAETPCVYGGGCIDGMCSAPCTGDVDCPGGTRCLQGAEWDIDVNEDEETDTHISVDMCVIWPHAGEEEVVCEVDADCPAGEHCQFRVIGDGARPDRTWRAERVCRADYEGQVAVGEACNAASGSPCGSDLCLVAGGQGNGLCTTYCRSADECPAQVEHNGTFWKTICLSFQVSANETVDPIDDAFVPYCWRTSPIGSVSECDENLQCGSAKEYCRAMAIAGNPDEPVVVEHRCLDASEGLAAFPQKRAGEACETWQECVGRVCLPDGEGGRYCSELCGSDADCQAEGGVDSVRCTEQVILPRPDAELSGKTMRCVRSKTCMTCEADGDCGGNYQCVNFGGLGFLSDLRCGEPCETSSDCLAPGTSCIEDTHPVSGELTGKKVCGPDFCPETP